VAVRRWDPTPYPDARERKVSASADGGVTVSPPRATVFNFSERTIADFEVRTAVSRKFNGPVFLRSLSFDGIFLTTAAVSSTGLIRYSGEGSGHGANGTGVTPPQGVDLFSTSTDGNGGAVAKYPNGYSPIHSSGNALNGLRYIDLNVYVDLPEVYLKATLIGSGATVNLFFGSIMLYESVDLELLPDLFG
jgi:hypothetical protein